ncbi:MAG: L-serine ammonia-lyase, iron-sulfur-dependent, subunit alpha [Lachnospiraceae bacterium]|nr:L-serine ammonia-lyase, iron-sulfur-dependent, subunit alpha [Lachnospiraceae bacterium]
MVKTDLRYQSYIKILEEELVPALGCTEPISLAYASAKAKDILGCHPEHVILEVSGSIIKNVKSVIVPNTHHLKGLEAACAAGIVAGQSEKELEVIADVNDEEKCRIDDYLKQVKIDVKHVETGHVFDITVKAYAGAHESLVRICDYHTNIVRLEKDGEVLFEIDPEVSKPVKEERVDRSLLTMVDIWDFVESLDTNDVKPILDRQIRYNMTIAEEGLLGDYGANIGSVLLQTNGQHVANRAKAYAAAGSDARMNGCELPVIINSGSGNQGITCSVPVIEYAKELHCGKDKLYRALTLSNLVAIHEKTGIGTLSAYCGAVSAGAGAGAGIAYLQSGDYEAVTHTVVNALAIVSGIVCDGAKASCAAKIAFSVDAGLMGYAMYRSGQEFKGGDGIVMKDIEATIKGIGRLGKDGMRQTNEEIINLMINSGRTVD